jgi:hypothetical protein
MSSKKLYKGSKQDTGKAVSDWTKLYNKNWNQSKKESKQAQSIYIG